MNVGVPTTLSLVMVELSTAQAIPKSITRGPSGESSTFDGLRSRVHQAGAVDRGQGRRDAHRDPFHVG